MNTPQPPFFKKKNRKKEKEYLHLMPWCASIILFGVLSVVKCQLYYHFILEVSVVIIFKSSHLLSLNF